ncbi:CaiB/BaiF CoA-transferase family protein [Bradyrhizobium sp. AS23.2]|uniref:CaiB/BaiF CoA transferase family protein n=1 Tax=Bradyrhizobium sp. AS23.2 TaxID=1680155 RepID=UPI00093C185C|nr:CaiB/BaiF CoA-transferase family protein [Bradyrhizobium sp. AS23.2]OKO81314.1 carnitine dehydratase [Bradyrhizobium sp. AS23.2]
MGPLEGLKVIEFGGIGPSPMCAMLLADLGATVLRLDRPEAVDLGVEKPLRYNLLLRGRPSMSVDLKRSEGVEFALDLLTRAEILIEGFRPGVMERIGLGPDICMARNPALVYGRMTGWGQDGPLARTAGHDLNYIAITGALDSIGRAGAPPTPPLNLVGDFGGGALYLAFGLLAALTSARATGRGQVVDAAMVDGAASLMTSFYGLHAAGLLRAERGTNVLDSGAPYYDVYQCADGRYIAAAPIEMKFRREFFERLGLLGQVPDGQDKATWPELRKALTDRIKSKTQAEWVAVFEGSDACVSPVLTMAEAASHPHNMARNTFVNVDGVSQPGPAPRFSRTVAEPSRSPLPTDANLSDVLTTWGYEPGNVWPLITSGVIGAAGRRAA